MLNQGPIQKNITEFATKLKLERKNERNTQERVNVGHYSVRMGN